MINSFQHFHALNQYERIFMKITLLTFMALLLLNTVAYSQQYELIWSDEFDQEQFNDTTWSAWIGTAYNNEDQYYSSRNRNIYVEGGNLYLVGLRENYGGREWTSGRIKSEDQFEFKYGKVEIRAKLPAGKGLWPAFWMLGSHTSQVGWPYGGEIDMMEYRGHLTAQTNGTIHFSAVNPENKTDGITDRRLIGDHYDLPSGNFASGFHLFQFKWTDSKMIWSIDGTEYQTITREKIEAQTNYYPFDKPFYLILNLAIGGNFLGDEQPDNTTPNRNEVIIDYVRVYQDSNEPPNVSLDYEEVESIEPPQNIKLKADVNDVDGSINKVDFFLNGKKVGSDSLAPYSVNWRASIDGCYNLKVKAFDNKNRHGSNLEPVLFKVGTGCYKRPYGGKISEFPGTIQLEHYNYGGQGIGYYETTPDTNLGNAQGNDLRTTEAVDLIPYKDDPGNYLLTATKSGEWLAYTVEVKHSGIYEIEFGAVPGSESARIDFTLDDNDFLYFTRISDRNGDTFIIKKATNVELQKGRYEFKMHISIDGKGIQPDYFNAILKESTSKEENGTLKPGSIELKQNYPNPFNPTTQVGIELNEINTVRLDVYNSLGQHIKNLYQGKLTPGSHTFEFNGASLSSGMYYYQIRSKSALLTKKMMLLK